MSAGNSPMGIPAVEPSHGPGLLALPPAQHPEGQTDREGRQASRFPILQEVLVSASSLYSYPSALWTGLTGFIWSSVQYTLIILHSGSMISIQGRIRLWGGVGRGGEKLSCFFSQWKGCVGLSPVGQSDADSPLPPPPF